MKRKKIGNSSSRRAFLYRLTALGIFSFLFACTNMFWVSVEELFYRIRGRLMPTRKAVPENEREFGGLPPGGSDTFLETAINSRCNSDMDGDSKVFHWGMFDPVKKLRQEDIQKIVDFADILKISERAVRVSVSSNELTFRIAQVSSGISKDHSMIVNGMQQQAICLVCAALGVGMVFQSFRNAEAETSDEKIATIKMKVDAMNPSYGGFFWTTDAPGKPWLKGNLPEPDRKGQLPLLPEMASLKLKNSGTAPVTEGSLAQVLWAARGRTPHLYKSKHCGLTIPTSRGEQKICTVFYLGNEGLFEYINQVKGKPTHALGDRKELAEEAYSKIKQEFNAGSGLLVFARNEDSSRALWEVGYQILNAVLQAAALGLSYQTFLLDETQKALIGSSGIRRPGAALALGCIPLDKR